VMLLSMSRLSLGSCMLIVLVERGRDMNADFVLFLGMVIESCLIMCF